MEVERMRKRELNNLINITIEKKKSKTRNILVFLVMAAVVFCVVLFYFWCSSSSFKYQREITTHNIVISVVCALFIGVITVLILQCIYDHKIEWYKSRLIYFGIEDAKENVDEDIYQNLIKISYKYLDEYYLQTRQQAQKGFWVTVSVSIIGAIIVAIGIGTMFLGRTTPAYVTTASGVITEFIAAIFFYLYNKTISSMSDYHNKLVLSQNVSIALKITESMSKEQGEKVKEHIVEELMKDINTYIHSEN